jgi:thioredoxin-like negative regulator of GroEL
MMDDLREIVTGEQLDEVVRRTERPVVVTFYADWCGDCRRLCPHVGEWAEAYRGRMEFVRVEDSRRELEARYGVHMIPDVIVFVRGKLTCRWVNVTDPSAYRATFDRILGAGQG